MNMHGFLFVIAPVDNVSIDHLLLEIRDRESDLDDIFALITTRDPTLAVSQVKAAEATIPPIPEDISNHWAGATLQEVEAFCLDLASETEHSSNLFVVVDEEGFSTDTCIINERVCDVNAKEITYLNTFRKMRVPWDEAAIIWCNLETANMGFEDFAENEEEVNGWYMFRESPSLQSEEDEGYRTDEGS
jgi:hypothetical protein